MNNRIPQGEQNYKLPPQAIETELAVLGTMTVSKASVLIVMELLDETCFYTANNKIIFTTMQEMFEKDTPIDVITLDGELIKKGVTEGVGNISGYIAVSENIAQYCKTLIAKSTLRQLINASTETTNECLESDVDPEVALDNAESKIFGISERKIKSTFESAGKLLPATFDQIEAYAKGEFTGIKTGFYDLDSLTTGLQGGDLIILAGRPSMGKTAASLDILLNATIKQKKAGAIFSLEMSKAQLMQRMLCSEARVNMHMLRSGTLPKRDLPKLSIAAGPISEANIFIDDTPSITSIELRAKARRQKMKYGLDLLIIDYMQLMGGGKGAENRQQEITKISRSLKGLAKELDIPVIALSQLSRALEQRTGDHRPRLSDLRESGAIEQDADIVLFVYRDEIYNKDDEENKGKAEIIIGKQRSGPLGTARLAFIKEFAKFENKTIVDDWGK